MSESHARRIFFRQSAWLGTTTLAAGALMTAVHTVASKLPESEYQIFGTMLKIFLLLGMPTAGVQIVFAQQAAAALTPELERTLASTTRGVLMGILGVWLVFLLIAIGWRNHWVMDLKLGTSAPLWPTLGITLSWLVLPVFRGIIQGQQNFGALGWVGILDAVGRLGSVAVIVLMVGGNAAGALYGAWIGQLLSLSLAFWITRRTWGGKGGPVDWGLWFRRVMPLTLAAGGLLLLSIFDVPYLNWAIPEARKEEFDLVRRYIPASTVSFALTQVTVPLAMVMFPKIARSTATGQKTDALTLALIGTGILGALAGLGVMLVPELPLRILYFTKPAGWADPRLLPWLVWAMTAYALANVLVGNLVARSRFEVAPWVAVIAASYVVAFWRLTPWLLTQPPIDAFRYCAVLVGGANLTLLLVALWVTRRARRSSTVSDLSPT